MHHNEDIFLLFVYLNNLLLNLQYIFLCELVFHMNKIHDFFLYNILFVEVYFFLNLYFEYCMRRLNHLFFSFLLKRNFYNMDIGFYLGFFLFHFLLLMIDILFIHFLLKMIKNILLVIVYWNNCNLDMEFFRLN